MSADSPDHRRPVASSSPDHERRRPDAAAAGTGTPLAAPVERALDVLVRLARERTAHAGRRSAGIRVLLVGNDLRARMRVAEEAAHRLGTTVVRIPIPAPGSRYIGETEKDLAAELARAADAGVVMFFDEADAIFGKRTAIRDSHDRYADARVLLDRIMAYPGITLVGCGTDTEPAAAARFDLAIELGAE